MVFRQIYDPYLAQYAYLIGCGRTGEAIVIDPERDVDRYVEAAEREDLRLVAAADTHIHADYLSGLRDCGERLGLRIYASGADEAWRYEWLDGSDIDYQLLHDGDTFRIGDVILDVFHTPGHTPEHLSFVVVDGASDESEGMGILTGDFVFVGDLGRPDLLESAAGEAGKMRPAARDLFRSVQQFKNLPAWMQVWPGHGAGSACGKALSAVPHSTVGYEVRHNAAIGALDRGEEDFVDEILSGQREPPLYFARMKRQNKDGPPLLASIPTPRRMDTADLAGLQGRQDVVLIDTRPRHEFLSSHVPGSLYAPFDSTFCATVGSYVEPNDPIFLVVDPADLEDAVRCLVRIGLDEVAGYFTPEDVRRFGGVSLEAVTFGDVARNQDDPKNLVVDVRSAAEYAADHILGALNIPHTRLRTRLSELPRDRTLFVHCASGVRSAVASALLQRHGLDVRYVQDTYERRERGA